MLECKTSMKDFGPETGIYSCLNEYMKIVSTKGQSHLLTFDLRLSYFDVLSISPLVQFY